MSLENPICQGLSTEQFVIVETICDRFDAGLQTGKSPSILKFLEGAPLSIHKQLFAELLRTEIEFLSDSGTIPQPSDYSTRFDQHQQTIIEVFEETCIDGQATDSTILDVDELDQKLEAFEVTEILGRGGMGAVYKARQTKLHRDVAIKVLLPDLASKPSFAARFQREANALARVQHQNIVSIYDIAQADDLTYLVMEFVDGATLHELVTEQGPIEIEEATRLIVQAATGLEFANREGIVHRDVKPDNLLLNKDGVVKVLDLGLSRFHQEISDDNLTDNSDTAGATRSGAVAGTAEFMAPEQGAGLKNADHRSDIYSLGCTLYFLLTGKAVFEQSNLKSVLEAHASAQIPSLADSVKDVPNRLDAAFQKMLAKAPEDRFQNYQELISALSCFSDASSQPIFRPAFARKLRNATFTITALGLMGWAGWQLWPQIPVIQLKSVQSFGDGKTSSSAVGDLDGDGDLDIVFGKWEDYGDRVWLNDGNGNFSELENTGLGFESETVLLINLDDDLHLDLVCSGKRSLMDIYFGNGDGTFRLVEQGESANSIGASVSGDVDGDGDLDVIISSGKWGEVHGTRVYLNNAGKLELVQTLSPEKSPFGISLADLDGDTLPDLFTCGGHGKLNEIWLNKDGKFELSEQSIPSQMSAACILEDFDNDGDNDLFLCNQKSDHELWQNDGSANFELFRKLPNKEVGHANSCSAADFNGDGLLDIYVSHFDGIKDQVFQASGDGKFEWIQDLNLEANWSTCSKPADFNGDQRPDLLVGSIGTNSIILNRTQ